MELIYPGFEPLTNGVAFPANNADLYRRRAHGVRCESLLWFVQFG